MLAKESMPLLCGLWLKTTKYFKSFVHESFFFSAPVELHRQPVDCWMHRIETGTTTEPLAPEHSPTLLTCREIKTKVKFWS